MAKKVQNNTIKATQLVVPKVDFEKELENCIEEANKILAINVTPKVSGGGLPYGYGNHLRKPEQVESEYQYFKKETTSWIDFVTELLKRSFDNPDNEYYRDFVKIGRIQIVCGNEDWVKEYKDEVTAKRDFLESLKNKLRLIPCIVIDELPSQSKINNIKSKKIFIVHGHDDARRLNVELLIKDLGYEPVVLFKEPNKGATIIEKLERETADVAFAIVIYTKCDEGKAVNETVLKPRARQNVVFEHGMMCCFLGRNKVVALVDSGVEIPGDLSGIIYITLDAAESWKFQLAKEMKAAGLNVDMNRL